MTFQQLKDERIEQAKNKIFTELMMITYFIVVISYCVKSIYFGMDLGHCATEFIILILAPVYQAVRSRQMGVVLDSGKKSPWRDMAYVLGVIVLLAALVFWRSHQNGQQVWLGDGLAAYFIAFVVVFAAVRFLVIRLEGRRRERLEHQYDDEE